MDLYLGMIFLWAMPWEPLDFMICDGRLLQVNQYQALYSLLGNVYGGNPPMTFALPDLRSRVPVGMGQGPAGLTSYNLAATGGTEKVQLMTAQMPVHSHSATVSGSATGTLSGITANGSLSVSAQAGNTNTPAANAVPAQVPDVSVSFSNHQPVNAYGAPDNTTQWPVNVNVQGGNVNLNLAGANVTVGDMGGDSAHENRQPYIALNYIMCVNGIYPQHA